MKDKPTNKDLYNGLRGEIDTAKSEFTKAFFNLEVRIGDKMRENIFQILGVIIAIHGLFFAIDKFWIK